VTTISSSRYKQIIGASARRASVSHHSATVDLHRPRSGSARAGLSCSKRSGMIFAAHYPSICLEPLDDSK
jgi:hypothetical protein